MKRRARLLSAAVAAVAVVAIAPLTDGGEAAAKPRPDHGRGYDVLFVRHAHTNYPQPEQELSARGIAEADALTERLADVPLDAVYTSMMVRSFQTGDGVAADHDLPVTADEDLSEVALDVSDVPPAQQAERYLGIISAWVHGEDRDQAYGESYQQVEHRWNDWWRGFVREHRGDDGTAMVVAHGGIYSLMLPETCANTVDPDFVMANQLDNTGMVRARLQPNGRLTCTEWNGVPIPGAP
ncbi:histidine phosphatase family protein [Nocardioides sambongensis]|uniref:histidine phosphatase family protein n=1 Tax=Nocardioides sambongensis TaxID=2589074 RepID=UPI00112B4D66|nr:histidine phosphatase family protein [Nocardioides sambongensis]